MTTAPAATLTGTSAVDPLGLFERALEVTGHVVAAVAPDEWALPTPCERWEARELTNHLVGGLQCSRPRSLVATAARTTTRTGSALTRRPPTRQPRRSPSLRGVGRSPLTKCCASHSARFRAGWRSSST